MAKTRQFCDMVYNIFIIRSNFRTHLLEPITIFCKKSLIATINFYKKLKICLYKETYGKIRKLNKKVTFQFLAIQGMPKSPEKKEISILMLILCLYMI